MCKKADINVWGVTKCICAMPEAAQAMIDGGAICIGDSRVENLKKLKNINCKKALLRIPMDCEADDVIRYSDLSLNSELSTLKSLGEAAKKAGKKHDVVIMIDLGDLREGILPKDADGFVKEALKIEGIKIAGFGVNLTCYGGVIPDENNLKELVDISLKLNEKYDLGIKIISGGNSSSLYLLADGKMPHEINNLRLGESILLGRETSFQTRIYNTYDDVFILKAKIVELKEKPSIPIGNIGKDAFGNTPSFKDKGIRKRAIIAAGRQDIEPLNIHSIDDENIRVIGASSDHTIVDVTDSKKNYKVGDILSFKMDYGCLLKAFTSDYVKKIIIDK